MQLPKTVTWILFCSIVVSLPATWVWSDGGYVSRSIAVSSDQRAIIIKNGDEISMTFSTGYTGEGEDFGWIIPTPVPPAIDDVCETGEVGEAVFQILKDYTTPIITADPCFPSGTGVLTSDGSRAIEILEPGTQVYSLNLFTGEWVLNKVLRVSSHHYEGDMVAIQLGPITIRATGNHPFYVLRGEQLISRPHPQNVPKDVQMTKGPGRWVEARDLKENDVLLDRNSEGLIITSVSIRYEKTTVYNLTVEDYYNYAVHQKRYFGPQ